MLPTPGPLPDMFEMPAYIEHFTFFHRSSASRDELRNESRREPFDAIDLQYGRLSDHQMPINTRSRRNAPVTAETPQKDPDGILPWKHFPTKDAGTYDAIDFSNMTGHEAAASRTHISVMAAIEQSERLETSDSNTSGGYFSRRVFALS
ncbi:hypothetical protein BDV97DRAFT_370402 [Delphinella strobiligena]|nr:hypothetical protein BDV97DRAFT_370402 [Delphinella strobiligena]